MAVRAEYDEREALVYLVRDDAPADPERQERLPDELVGVLRPYLPPRS